MSLKPNSFHGRALIEYKKKQAIWFKTCSISHQLFCNCGDWQVHLQRYCYRQQCTIEGNAFWIPSCISSDSTLLPITVPLKVNLPITTVAEKLM
uniref:ORF4 n=1 Tax=Giant panda anellovirus TaxID=2016460 RepID=A0A220IGJ3_9VIRU|nr:ORF4 [Giant panda anellovirus]